MLIKFIGGLLIILSTGFIGIVLSRKYSLRPKLLNGFRFSMQLLETEIIFASTPLPYAFSNISNRADRPWNNFFKGLSNDILKRKYYSMEEAWIAATKEYLSIDCLSKTDIELIKRFGRIVGKSDLDDQKKHFQLLYAQLDYHQKIAESDRKKNVRMYKSLGILLGIAIFVVLV